jgi:hypothetical protein
MKKVLIIAHLYHSSPRIPGIAKNLKNFGWEVTIVTPPINSENNSFGSPHKDIKSWCTIVETTDYGSIKGRKKSRKLIVKDYLDGKKEGLKFLRYIFLIFKSIYRLLKRIYHEIIWFPDSEKKWIPLAIKKCDSLLRINEYDVVLSSSSPVSAHVIANALSNKYNIPWITDFRDLWSQNHDYPYSLIRRYFDRKLEERKLAHVEKIITVSKPLEKQLTQLHKGKSVVTITNGYDHNIYDYNIPLTDKFTLTYTGQIYNQQDPEKILITLFTLINENKINKTDIILRFYGPSNREIEKLVFKYQLEDLVELHEPIPPEESIKKQKESQLLLLLNWENRMQNGIYTQKIFDYLGAMRPILATGGYHNNDVKEDLINQTNAGKYCSTKEEIKSALLSYYSDYKMNKFVTYNGIQEELLKYNYYNLAKDFSRQIDSLVN